MKTKDKTETKKRIKGKKKNGTGASQVQIHLADIRSPQQRLVPKLQELSLQLQRQAQKSSETIRGDSFRETVRSELSDPGNVSHSILQVHNLRNGRAAAMVHQIDEAIRNIEEGNYGICKRCGHPIGERRLQVMPYATHCATCANELEKEKGNAHRHSGSDGMQFLWRR